MPIERILIKPDLFRIKNSSDTVIFSTDNKYLKTDSNGVFPAGGNTPSPVFFGTGAGAGWPLQSRPNLGGMYLGTIFNIPDSQQWLEIDCPGVDRLEFQNFGNIPPGQPTGANNSPAVPVYYNNTQIGTATWQRVLFIINNQVTNVIVDGPFITITGQNSSTTDLGLVSTKTTIYASTAPAILSPGILKIPMPKNTAYSPWNSQYYITLSNSAYIGHIVGHKSPNNLSLSSTL